MQISIVQMNSKSNDIDHNFRKMKRVIMNEKSEVVIFPALAITGAGCRDNFLDAAFIEAQNEKIEELKSLSAEKDIICGVAYKSHNGLYNAVVEFSGGEEKILCFKKNLSADEKKYFVPGNGAEDIEYKGRLLTVTLDEPVAKHMDFILNFCSEPYRTETLKKRLKNKDFSEIFINPVGIANNEIFDGRSFVTDKSGNKILAAPAFEECILRYVDSEKLEILPEQDVDEYEQTVDALSFALKTFCENNGFKKVVLGLSGGIDSALTCCLAVKALGRENVVGITMPSEFSSTGSVDDSLRLAENLGIECLIKPIKPVFDTFVEKVQEERHYDLAEENLQSRIRALILMNYSNRNNALLLATGNKSECAMGYCTLYGDTCGGVNLISDVYKTDVYKLSKVFNREREIIPESTMTKAPSAELRPDQKDSDSLPEYDVLDKVLRLYFEQRINPERIRSLCEGVDTDAIIAKVKRNEFKRKQATAGFKISKCSFVKDVDFAVM